MEEVRYSRCRLHALAPIRLLAEGDRRAQRQPRAQGVGAVAQQGGHTVRVTRLAAFSDQGGTGAQPAPQQVVVQATDR